ncbi:MAG: aldehyde dehydrogenase family protein, partial [Pseudomonadota bacterium]
MSQRASNLGVAVSTPDYSDLVAELGSAFASGRTRPLKWRAKQLTGLIRMMDECEDELLGALKADLGKPGQEAWMTELSYVAGAAAYARRRLKRWSRARRVPTPLVAQPAKSWVQPEPLGTVLVIGAWNYPLQLTLSGAAAAIAAGNCVVVKPSELAPATSLAIARLLPEYVDTECVRVVEGSVPETTALLEQSFDHILYTGGGTVGRIVMRAAAENLTPVTLELGGKSPCVVLPDADLETAASRIAWGKFTNAGQTCVAPDYVLTDTQTERKLVPLIERAIRSMFGDDPSASTSYGRIVNERHFDRLSALLDSGRAAVGGQHDRASRYIAPTVLTEVPVDSPIMREEIFGPLLPIVRADGLDAAIEHIRAGDKPLSAYLFTRDSASERRFVDEVSCGNLCLNDTMMFMAVEELPFGGVGASGMGAYSGEHGFLTFSHMKAVIRRGWWP